MTKTLLLVETDEFLIEFLKKKTSEPRGMILMQLDGRNCIVYKVFENITDDSVISIDQLKTAQDTLCACKEVKEQDENTPEKR